jgi:hypothetical protein
MRLFTGILLAGLLLYGLAEAVETKVIIRAKAKDAKFIGSSMGGALVVIRDSETGEILKRGITTGSTGDTRLIMIDPITRGKRIAPGPTARYETTLDIDEPKLVKIEVSAPYVQRQSIIKASTELWLIPGKHILGDGIIIELPGFSLDVISPQTHSRFGFNGGKGRIPIRANLVML